MDSTERFLTNEAFQGLDAQATAAAATRRDDFMRSRSEKDSWYNSAVNNDVNGLVSALRTEKYTDLARKRLTRIGPPSVGPLVSLLQAGDVFERCVALEALAGIDNPEVLAPILAALGDDEKLVRTKRRRGTNKGPWTIMLHHVGFALAKHALTRPWA